MSSLLPRDAEATLLIHNPRCSKSRQTLALLEERGVDFEVRAYLDEPLTREELTELGKRLARPVAEWVRTGEPCYQEAGLAVDSSDDALLDAIAKHPKLLQRPIVVRGDRAEIGRPPEQVLELF
jgi:arsenate reductase